MKVFANSIPKSGTHLLAALLRSSGAFLPAGFSINRKTATLHPPSGGSNGIPVGIGDPLPASVPGISGILASVEDGQYVTGHVPHSPAFVATLRSRGFRSLLIVRDPRDVALSMLRYVEGQPNHFLHDYLMSFAPNERLLAVVDGFQVKGMRLMSSNDQFECATGWLSEPGCCVVLFENLVGERGGGSLQAQTAETERVFRHLDVADVGVSLRAAAGAYDRSSPTFRSGQTAAWKTEMPSALSASLAPRISKAMEVYERFRQSCRRT